MYYKIEDFKNDWTYESGSTLQLFNNLTDESLNKKFNDNVRTLGRLAWHITGTIPEMMNRTDLKIKGLDENLPIPKSAGEIAGAYKIVSDELINEVLKNWNDKNLSDKVNMYGEEWEKGKILSILLIHQTHHRAQMTVLMRLAGLKVSGIYGPSREEWADMKMPAQE